ncbi:hypothetical protein [Roseobacter sp. HKCCA0434]|uniref:hypothetical protein n=1 Tax=Roseobacter sp. HKCCA0434 TaxID=3079297 RepID=UPI002905A466|nr:hypothetical protein [Roseobacter sp. HKCCA0434]
MEGNSDGERITYAAGVEPTLQLPARIGIARIANGRLTTPTAAEAALWQDLADDNPSKIRQAVFISPLLAEFTASSARAEVPGGSGDVVETIRLGSARQHVDAVLIYEIAARSARDINALSVFDITIIGAAILPSRSVEAVGTANALLLDTVSGYPYGTATASTELSDISTGFGTGARAETLRR